MTNVAGGFALAPHGGAGTLRRGEMTAERQAADRAGPGCGVHLRLAATSSLLPATRSTR
jgi:hypothetical protein